MDTLRTRTTMAIDLDTAVKAHIDWLGRLMQALQRNHAPAELRAETNGACLFSRWLTEQRLTEQGLTEQGARLGRDAAAMRRVGDCHLAMHRMAAALLQMPHSDEAYYASLDQFCRTAIEFNRLVAALGPSVAVLRCSA